MAPAKVPIFKGNWTAAKYVFQESSSSMMSASGVSNLCSRCEGLPVLNDLSFQYNFPASP